jgi:hypothetical protein
MNYSMESVFDYIANAVDAEVQGVRITSHREPVAKSLPALYVREMNRTRPQRYATLANDDEQWESTFEAEIYVNDLDGARTNAYNILYVVEDAFKRLGYFETFCEPLDNIDPSLFRINARFTRQIGKGDILPTT